MKKGKIVSIVSVILAATVFLGACASPAPTAAPTPTPAPAPAATPAPAEPVADEGFVPNYGQPATIRISWWGSDPRHEAIMAALDIYMDRYPHITIEPEFGAFSGWMDAMILQLAGRAEPDIMQINYAWAHAFGSGENVFLDLNTVGHILDLTEWSPELLEFMTTADGQLAGVPHGVTGRVIIYSKEMLERFGLTEFPATFDELIDFGAQVAQAAGNTPLDQGHNEYAFFPLDWQSLDIILLTLLYNETGRNLEENGVMLHTVEEVEAVFDLFGRMIQTNTIPTFEQQEPPLDATNPVWMQGRGGSVFEWVSNIFLAGGNFQENNLEGLGVALLPAMSPGGGQAIMQRPSLAYAISQNSDHPEVAAHVLNFLFTDEEALVTIAHQLGIPASRTAVYIAERDGQIFGLQLEGLELLLANPGTMCPLFEDPNMRNPRQAIIEAFRTGSIDARVAAERFVNEQQAALDNMR